MATLRRRFQARAVLIILAMLALGIPHFLSWYSIAGTGTPRQIQLGARFVF